MRRARVVVLLAASLVAASRARAQSTSTVDPIFQRARRLVVGGNGSAGRLLIDSVLSATPAGTAMYGEALYWRAALAASTADAEHDYLRLVLEYPLSSHSGDALLQLAQLESARGDRVAATRHLSQFLADNPKHPERIRATLLYARLLLEQNDLPRGCAALKQTLKDVPDSQVETRNQLEYYLPRCAANDVSAGGAAPVTPPPKSGSDSSTTDSVPTVGPESTSKSKVSAKMEKTPASPRAQFTLQVAAYKTKADADALVRKLKARKLDARVVGTAKPYRVQVGRYATRAAATAAQKELKAKKIDAFVTAIDEK